MAKRESKKVIAGITPEEFQESLHEYAQCDATIDKLTAAMNIEINRVKEKYDGRIAEAAEQKEKQQQIVQAYCMENKKQLFSERRSLEMIYGEVGFRLGTPKLKLLPKFTWDKVLDKLKAVMPEYVRTKEEVNKDALLDGRNDEAVAPHLNAVGVWVDQDENFFIKLKKEEPIAAE
jgi:phage host-nuclease inhibitor protein Gam